MKICNYNPLVDCKDDAGCVGCGWNPEVSEERKKDVRKARCPEEPKERHILTPSMSFTKVYRRLG